MNAPPHYDPRMNAILEEVSHMLNEYAAAILTSGC